MEKYIENKFLRLILLFVIGVFLQFNNIVIAQEVSRPGTQISDNTAPHSLDPLTFSILDLNSAEKGFLMPRMTTAERMRIPTQELVGGMAIYNTTIDCIEFYNATRQKWMSTCGDVEPAIFTIPDDKCSSIVPSGEYAEKVFLDSRKNLIAIEVNVSAAGTYNIEAIAYDNDEKLNGYSFAAQGVFPSEGNFTVILKGHGTPKKGYPRNVDGTPTAKDTIVFLFNNKEVSCKVSNIVDTKAITYDLVEVIQSGEFFTKVNVVDPKTTGKITVKINNISQAGIVEIKTATQNGISFSGRKVLNQNEVNSRTATIDLIASGVPSTPANLPFDFVSNSYVRHEDGEPAKKITKIVAISPVNVASDCKGAIFGKEFKVNEALTSEHIITVPVKVTATGRGRVIGTIATGNGQTELIEYASETLDFVFNAANTDVMNVELKPISGTGKPKVGGRNLVMKLQLESKGLKEYLPSEIDEKILKDICSLNVPVKSGFAKINTSNIIPVFKSSIVSIHAKRRDWISGVDVNAPYITPRTTMSSTGDKRFKVEIYGIVPKSEGKWEFETQEINGVTFKGSGSFSETDIDKSKNVTLYAYGESETDMPTQVIPIYSLDAPGVDITQPYDPIRRLEVDYVYKPMKIYSIGGEAWHPGGNYNKTGTYEGGPALFQNDDHFAFKTDAVVRIDDLEILMPGKDVTVDHLTIANLGTLITNLRIADIVFVGSATYNKNLSKDNLSLDKLVEFVNNGKVLISGDGEPDKLNYLTSGISEELKSTFTTTESAVADARGAAKFVSTSEVSALIRGTSTSYFGAKYDAVTLYNNNIAPGYATVAKATSFMISKSSLPSDYEVLATYNTNANYVFAFMHKTKGFVGVASSNFMGGTRVAGTRSNTYPARSIDKDSGDRKVGAPITAPYSGGTTYNSWFILNMTHWAIDYIQRKDNK